MSVATVTARVAELRTLIEGEPATTTTAPGFDQALMAATSPSPLGLTSMASPTATATPAGATPFAGEIDAAATRNGVDPALLRALIRQESNFDPSAQSPAGAQGLTQLMPATARGLGVDDPLDPIQAIEGGARYLRQMLDRFGGDVTQALAGYNAGPGAVERFGGVPPYDETERYVRQVMTYADQYRAAASSTPLPPATSTTLPYTTE